MKNLCNFQIFPPIPVPNYLWPIPKVFTFEHGIYDENPCELKPFLYWIPKDSHKNTNNDYGSRIAFRKNILSMDSGVVVWGAALLRRILISFLYRYMKQQRKKISKDLLDLNLIWNVLQQHKMGYQTMRFSTYTLFFL